MINFKTNLNISLNQEINLGINLGNHLGKCHQNQGKKYFYYLISMCCPLVMINPFLNINCFANSRRTLDWKYCKLLLDTLC